MGGGASDGELTGFEALPDFCVLEILQKCDGADILSFQGVSRWALSVGRMPSLWRRELEEQYGLNLPQPLSNDYRFLSNLHGRLMGRSHNKLLPFRGLMTDGGVQEGRTMFWVDNMFARRPSLTYCSDILKERDVRCLGAHKPGDTSVEYAIRHMIGENKREVMYDETMLKELRSVSEEDKSDPHLVVTREIIIGRMGDISCPVSCGAVLIGTIDFDQTNASEEEVAKQLYSDAGSELAEHLSSFKDLDAILESCQKKEVPPPRVVGCNRMGEWVEFGGRGMGWKGSLHPVVWFRFLTKDESLEGRRERFEHFKREFGKFDNDCEFPDTSEPNDEATSADPQGEGPEGGVPLGGETDTRLWLEAVIPINATHRFMLGKEHMQLTLRKPVVGNLACAVLISCENWMEQTWMRGGPNIDVNFVYLVGEEIPLVQKDPSEVSVPEVDQGTACCVEIEEEVVCWEALSEDEEENEQGAEQVDDLISRIDGLWFGRKKT
ncbi:hypothetical protein BSKO_09458 [Bryopsis sp. KO-2023]|nr:hypothetical protein BSKO_09458 [Bryopsis sp. KO-2023]